jgi:hypothetical protein
VPKGKIDEQGHEEVESCVEAILTSWDEVVREDRQYEISSQAVRKQWRR